MVHDFNRTQEENALIESRLLALKEEYEKPKMSKEQYEKMMDTMEEAKRMDSKECNKKRVRKMLMVAAACMGVLFVLPNTSATVAYAMEQIPFIGQLVEVITFRDYQHESDRNYADIEVPEVKLNKEVDTIMVKEELEKTTTEINAEIKRITDELIEQFEVYLEEEEGYQDVVVKSEVLATTQEYFTLKLLCYQGAGSGYQWNYYYTVDLNTGKRLQLEECFVAGADYITPISENIKEQMQKQMDADENVYYWLNDEMEDLNFKAITEETDFYINEKGNIVIAFDEGDVAPMYMGTIEFEIPAEILIDIRK